MSYSMGNGAAAVLKPTYTGYVSSTQDALILFEACLSGLLQHVPRRPHDRERSQLVKSGSIFIYEENASGIKRWTDGVTWSPSRILGNFLVYRELDKPFPPGEKKRAMKKGSRRPVQATRPGEPYPRPQENNGSAYPTSTSPGATFGERTQQSELERQLVGSLVDSYGFKEAGLVKKTMSVTVNGVTHHLVSYYSLEDVVQNAMNVPSHDENLRYIRPRAELTSKQSFRAPIDDFDQPQTGHTTLEEADPAALYPYRAPVGAPPYAVPVSGPSYAGAPQYAVPASGPSYPVGAPQYAVPVSGPPYYQMPAPTYGGTVPSPAWPIVREQQQMAGANLPNLGAAVDRSQPPQQQQFRNPAPVYRNPPPLQARSIAPDTSGADPAARW
ncbi:hypothetical protein FQN52_004611 [Onygenales sp. PD_12]|nr:hypothetical protein FQN53_001751 [Emmonsiellopsis sp. PD_33]KAK2791695.1 hypothetical protein FQN52_004611 [Onygenales sp. PD_12]KAK2792114.1 hypothetical protein FQN51_001909 [Onygenales sp. PD_10]